LADLILYVMTVVMFLPLCAGAGEDPQTFYERGREAYNRFSDDHIKAAIIFFEKAIEGSPSFSPAYSALAEAYIQEYLRNPEASPGLLEKAAAAAEKALFTDARSASAHKAIASVYYAKGMVAEAIEELERAIDMVPDYARALLNLGACWLAMEDRERALGFFRDAVNADNDDLAKGIAYYNMASLEADEKRFDSSLEVYRKAAGLVPDYYNIHYGLGVVYMNLDRDGDAVESFREAVRLKADYIPGHMGLASAYHRLGNKPSAMKAYEAVLAVDPESEEAEKGLAALKGKKIGCLFIY